MKRTLVAAAFLLAGSFANAEISSQSVVEAFQAEGYTRIEVTQGPTQVKVEAIRGTEKMEVIYDRETGNVLKQEQERVRAGEDVRQGVEVRTRGDDFLSGRDDDDDHRGRGRGRDNDDDEDDDDDHDDDHGRDHDDDDDDHDDDHGDHGPDHD